MRAWQGWIVEYHPPGAPACFKFFDRWHEVQDLVSACRARGWKVASWEL